MLTAPDSVRNSCLCPLPSPTTTDVTGKVPIINTVVGENGFSFQQVTWWWLVVSMLFFHIGLLLQGLMLADYNSVASHFRFI